MDAAERVYVIDAAAENQLTIADFFG